MTFHSCDSKFIEQMLGQALWNTFLALSVQRNVSDFSSSTNSRRDKYEAFPESKDTKVLNVYNISNLQKRHCEWIACT